MTKSKVGAEPKKKELDMLLLKVKVFMKVFTEMSMAIMIVVITTIVLLMVISFIEEKV